jgi:hypothetical protein
MAFRIFCAAMAIVIIACMDQQADLSIHIIQPRDGDTIHTNFIPVEGATTPGAVVRVSGTLSDTGIRVYPDSSGHFLDTLPIPDENGPYSAVFTVKMDTRMIQESRSVYYIRMP